MTIAFPHCDLPVTAGKTGNGIPSSVLIPSTVFPAVTYRSQCDIVSVIGPIHRRLFASVSVNVCQIRCVEEVNARGWNVEGLYRVPGYDSYLSVLSLLDHSPVSLLFTVVFSSYICIGIIKIDL